MTEPYRHSVSVAAVVTNDEGKILVIQRRDNGAWQLPGGILEQHESIHDGLCREVVEETGIHVEPLYLTGIYKNMTIGVVALVFRAKYVKGTAESTDESTAVDWWTSHQAVDAMTEAFSVRITDALQKFEEPAIRHHDGTNLLQI